jgi:hypothetical protein
MANRTAIRFLLLLAWLAIVPPAVAPAFGQDGTITGAIVDSSGAFVPQVNVTLSLDGRAPDRETQSTGGGEFSFSSVAPGWYHLSFAAPGFEVQTIAGELHAGETLNVPRIALGVATFTTEVNVSPTDAERAEAQIKVAEKQRLVGFVPNYFVNYDADAAPLSAKQKFELTRKTLFDPATFAINGVIAGIEQARNTRPGFGRGAEGYAKRYGAAYADSLTGALLARVVLPTIIKQDPRYFYKGAGTTRARVFYAISRSVVCRGDNKRDQVCYSRLISRLASGLLTNLYYPPADRNSNAVTLENAAIRFGGSALGNLFQEFIARKLTRENP